MRIYIEGNVKYSRGYQVRFVGDGGETDVVDYRPYTLAEAVFMADKALSIINRRLARPLRLKEVLEIDRDSVAANGEYDDLSGEMLFLMNDENEGQGVE